MHPKRLILLAGALTVSLMVQACAPDAGDPLSSTRPSLTHEIDTGAILQFHFTIDGCEAPGDPSAGVCFGYYEREIAYDWSLNKTVNPSTLVVDPGATGSFDFTITATRTKTGEFDVFGVRGESCIRNIGNEATAGLSVTQVLYYWEDTVSDWVLLKEEPVDVSGHPILYPWDFTEGTEADGMPSYTCYPYDVDIGDTAPFQNPTFGTMEIGVVTITNYHPNGEPGEPTSVCPEDGICARAFFTFPSEPTVKEIDATGYLAATVSCPSGFSCGSVPTTGLGTINDSWVVAYPITVTHTTASCEPTYTVANGATLTLPSGAGHSATAPTTLYVECTGGGDGGNPPPVAIQTCGPGFWKQSKHHTFWVGKSPSDAVSGTFASASIYNLGDNTLLQALNYRGGSGAAGAARNLLRAAVAAALNHTYSAASLTNLQTVVNGALGSGDRAEMIALGEDLDAANNAGKCTVK